MTSKIELELQKATGSKPKKKEDRQKYLSRLVGNLADLVDTKEDDAEDVKAKADAVWEDLSEEAQAWYNDAVNAETDSKKIKDFKEDKEEEEAEEIDETESKVEASEEDEDEEDAEDVDTEENDTETEEDEDKETDVKTKKKVVGRKGGKAPAKEKEAKAKKAKGNGAGGGRKARFSKDAKITVLAKENPRRAGKAKEVFKLYKTGMTVEEFIKKGGKMGYVATDVKRGNIKVS